MQFFDVVGESVFRNAHQKSLGQSSHFSCTPVIQVEIDLRIVADAMAKVAHAKVQMTRKQFFADFSSKRSSNL